MYYDLTIDELQAWLLADGISDDAILAPEDDWQSAQALRTEVRDTVYVRQCLEDEDIDP